MPYEHMEWCCEYCNEGFDSLEKAEIHEENCDQKEDKEEY